MAVNVVVVGGGGCSADLDFFLTVTCQLESVGIISKHPQPWKRKRNFWYAVTVKSYVCVCVSRLRAVC